MKVYKATQIKLAAHLANVWRDASEEEEEYDAEEPVLIASPAHQRNFLGRARLCADFSL